MAHHHKARTSSKKENKRIEHKSVRQAEVQALKGGNVRVVRGFAYGHRLPQPPLPDETPHNKKKRSKVRKPKERCPVNRTHEWYKEVITKIGPWYYWDRGWFAREPHKSRATLVIRKETCIHCWKERCKVLSRSCERMPL